MALSREKEGSHCQERGQDSRLCWGPCVASPVLQLEPVGVLRVPTLLYTRLSGTLGPKLADASAASGRGTSLTLLVGH